MLGSIHARVVALVLLGSSAACSFIDDFSSFRASPDGGGGPGGGGGTIGGGGSPDASVDAGGDAGLVEAGVADAGEGDAGDGCDEDECAAMGAACHDGRCRLVDCEPNMADCVWEPEGNFCETNIADNEQHCGGCTHECTLLQTCNNGHCGLL